uniref:Uncharacterized protein n=1 Tax=Ananas comosus var. bracteatus TaxID=296719 RepID=A0A6V7NJ32_ANACO|nr:unnamed protein product [Ananas comosus var. bracteatus]
MLILSTLRAARVSATDGVAADGVAADGDVHLAQLLAIPGADHAAGDLREVIDGVGVEEVGGKVVGEEDPRPPSLPLPSQESSRLAPWGWGSDLKEEVRASSWERERRRKEEVGSSKVEEAIGRVSQIFRSLLLSLSLSSSSRAASVIQEDILTHGGVSPGKKLPPLQHEAPSGCWCRRRRVRRCRRHCCLRWRRDRK